MAPRDSAQSFITEATESATAESSLAPFSMVATTDLYTDFGNRNRISARVKTLEPKISPGVAELFDALRANGKTVYLVSGGFRQMIAPVAERLGVPTENIFANNILFDEAGEYESFDPTEFTSKAGGKAEAVKHIKAKFGHGTMAMVGDGATDLESRAPGGADVFVGYGGVQQREAVMEGADWFVTDFDKFIEVVSESK